MKVQQKSELSAFGGINFVLELLEQQKIGQLINQELPSLPAQSKYKWSDVIYSLLTIYFCGGDSIEDLQAHLKPHFKHNHLINLPSPDTVLRRMSELSVENKTCQTERGIVTHNYNTNEVLSNLNLKILNLLGVFNSKEITLDYDNTIIFSEKQDCKMTYKRQSGYQPGVCTVNENYVLYMENRGGNSDAKSFQHETLKRIFETLYKTNIRKVDHFRADAASFQQKTIEILEDNVKNFYIGCRNSYIEKHFQNIPIWNKAQDNLGEEIEIGEITIPLFNLQNSYRLVVKRKQKESRQLDIFTNDSYEYHAIITNNKTWNTFEIIEFYNKRGNMEKQFDILKNDFGWNNMPFSNMGNNLVFLYLTAIIRNLYSLIINHFSKKTNFLKPFYRLKKFIFRFIILPSKWILRSRQRQLVIYSNLSFVT